MFRKDDYPLSTGIFLGQNQLGHPEFTQVHLYYDGLRGGLRPKIYHPEPAPNPLYKTLGNMYVRVDGNADARHVLVRDLTEDGKAHATSDNPNAWAVYRKDTVWTCYEIKDNPDHSKWGRSPSGWICIRGASGVEYCVKES